MHGRVADTGRGLGGRGERRSHARHGNSGRDGGNHNLTSSSCQVGRDLSLVDAPLALVL